MAHFDDLILSLLQAVEHRLEFKEAALRYCNHSKKRDKLFKEVQSMRSIAEHYRYYLRKKEDSK